MKKPIIIAGIIAVAILILGAVRSSGKPDFEMYETYVIKSGDTLWGIAKEYKPAGMGYREYIYKLREHNGITAELQPGQAIEVLVYEEENDEYY